MVVIDQNSALALYYTTKYNWDPIHFAGTLKEKRK